jgi:protein-arginine kinase activator protein McsA
LRLQHLRKELADALSWEQYERAAEIRDLLTTLGVTTAPAVETEPPKSKRRERRAS